MQKDIGPVMGLYPMPCTVCGTVLEDGRVNWLPIAHVGIVEYKRLSISVDQNHDLTEPAIRKNGTVSVSLINPSMMVAADYCGIAKAAKTDKSGVFTYRFGDVPNAPILEEAPVCMTCEVVDTYVIGKFTNFILKPVHTYVQEECLNERGKIDYVKCDPVLFEFQSAQYLSCGPVIGQCWKEGNDYPVG